MKTCATYPQGYLPKQVEEKSKSFTKKTVVKKKLVIQSLRQITSVM